MIPIIVGMLGFAACFLLGFALGMVYMYLVSR